MVEAIQWVKLVQAERFQDWVGLGWAALSSCLWVAAGRG